MDQLIVV